MVEIMFEQYKNDKFDVIIMAGQSNACGSGLGYEEDAYKPVADVFMLSNGANKGAKF